MSPWFDHSLANPGVQVKFFRVVGLTSGRRDRVSGLAGVSEGVTVGRNQAI